jgi:hypothetical protein
VGGEVAAQYRSAPPRAHAASAPRQGAVKRGRGSHAGPAFRRAAAALASGILPRPPTSRRLHIVRAPRRLVDALTAAFLVHFLAGGGTSGRPRASRAAPAYDDLHGSLAAWDDWSDRPAAKGSSASPRWSHARAPRVVPCCWWTRGMRCMAARSSASGARVHAPRPNRWSRP